MENISIPGEYTVDVIASYLGKTASNTSAMFVLGTITGSGSTNTNVFATGTVTMASVVADDTVTINNLIYKAVNGVKSDNTEFRVDDATGDGVDENAAIDLADSINNDGRGGTSGDVSATSSTDTVTVTTDVLGTAGNAITLVSSNGDRLAVSGNTFSGGVD